MIPGIFQNYIFPEILNVCIYHFFSEFAQGIFCYPTQFLLRFCWVSQQQVYLGGPEIAFIDFYDNITFFQRNICSGNLYDDTLFGFTGTFKLNRYASMSKRQFYKIPDCSSYSGSNYKIFRFIWL